MPHLLMSPNNPLPCPNPIPNCLLQPVHSPCIAVSQGHECTPAAAPQHRHVPRRSAAARGTADPQPCCGRGGEQATDFHICRQQVSDHHPHYEGSWGHICCGSSASVCGPPAQGSPNGWLGLGGLTTISHHLSTLMGMHPYMLVARPHTAAICARFLQTSWQMQSPNALP